MEVVDSAFNGILTGSAGFAMTSIQPNEHPFLFAAAAIGVCHGLLGLYGNLGEGTNNSKEAETASDSVVGKLHSITRACLELATFPLVNIDLYSNSSQSTPLALGHSLFVIPLAFDLSFKVFDVNGDGDSTETLKELTILGNVVSLLFLAINEERLPLGLMALAALYADYAPWVMDSIHKGSGENAALCGYSAFFAMIPWALGLVGNTGPLAA